MVVVYSEATGHYALAINCTSIPLTAVRIRLIFKVNPNQIR